MKLSLSAILSYAVGAREAAAKAWNVLMHAYNDNLRTHSFTRCQGSYTGKLVKKSGMQSFCGTISNGRDMVALERDDPRIAKLLVEKRQRFSLTDSVDELMISGSPEALGTRMLTTYAFIGMP